MNENWVENASVGLRKKLPFFVSVLLVLCAHLPFNFLFLKNLHPALSAICVYFWLQHRPDLFNLWSVFGLGLIEGFLSTAPLGITIFELLLLYTLVNVSSRILNAKPFVVLWYGFMVLFLISVLAKWLLLSVYYSEFLPLFVLFFSYLVTIAVYPLVSLLLAFVQNRLMRDDS